MKLPLRDVSHCIDSVRRIAAMVILAGLLPAAAGAAPDARNLQLQARAVTPTPQGARGLCRTYNWACARSSTVAPAGGNALGIAQRINARVNARVHAISDVSQYGVAEKWTLPTKRGGDCEDYVLLKKKELIEAGLPPRALLIATVLDRKRDPHAVLVMRTTSGDYVLDNLHNRILPWQKTGYSFLKMQNPDAPQRWNAILAGGVFGPATASTASIAQ